MSDDFADSTVEDDYDEEEEKRMARGGKTDGMARRLKALFCCLGRKQRADGTVESVEFEYYNKPDECDYVVEKLVVRRVPLALFAIPVDDLADSATRSTSTSTSTSSSAVGGADRAAPNATRGLSTRLVMKRTATANETLRLANERRNSVSERLDCRARSVGWRDESYRFNALHPDLKESDCPLEDSQNFSRNKRLFAEDISEVTSSTRTEVSSRTTSSATVQDDVPTRDDSTQRGTSKTIFGFGSERKPRVERDEAARDASSGKERDKFVPGRNRKYIVSPFRVRRGSFDLAKLKNVVGDLRVDGKSLSYIEESLEDKSTEPTGDVKDRDLGSNTAVRWRITVRRQRANATLEHAVSEPCPSLEGKTHR